LGRLGGSEFQRGGKKKVVYKRNPLRAGEAFVEKVTQTTWKESIVRNEKTEIRGKTSEEKILIAALLGERYLLKGKGKGGNLSMAKTVEC